MKKSLLFLTFACIVALSIPAAAEESQSSPAGPVADAVLSSQGVVFIPHIGYKSLELRVLLPDGKLMREEFKTGQSPEFRLPSGTPDGVCTWELRVTPAGIPQRTRDPNDPTRRIRGGTAPVQSGHFRVSGGSVVVPAGSPEISSPMDEVIYDDVIIDGSLCVGNDCYSGLAFGFDTIVMMENNLRIYFDDTSNTASFPNNDWRIVINDTTDGGASYFAVQDVSGGLTPFTIEAGAKNNSLYVDDDGQVGIGTSAPVFELHIAEGDTPAVRLEQTTAYGWPGQIWDMGGNETSFFIRDGTHAARLPFRIEPETPTSTLCLKADGFVGIGTWSPEFKLHVETTGENAIFSIQRTDGAQFKLSAVTNKVQIGSQSNHDVRFTTNNTARMVITNTGNVGINELSPTHLLQLGGGAYCDGGAWVAGSSRAFKTDIRDLDGEDASAAVMSLKPVRFHYRHNRAEEYLGFIAEDVPELVAMKDRQGMTAMDVVAALTKVVQQQQQTIQTQKAHLDALKAEMERQKAEFTARLEKLEKR